jgi:predicted DNA-binding transcriptional regulator AlpA
MIVHFQAEAARHRCSGFQVFPPRLLTKAQAASYCGMGIESFTMNCEVKPIRVRSGARGLRWDIQDLDKWIDRLKENSSTDSEKNVDWLAKFDGQNQDKRRQGLRQQG